MNRNPPRLGDYKGQPGNLSDCAKCQPLLYSYRQFDIRATVIVECKSADCGSVTIPQDEPIGGSR